jgi:hypothetical protein
MLREQETGVSAYAASAAPGIRRSVAPTFVRCVRIAFSAVRWRGIDR